MKRQKIRTVLLQASGTIPNHPKWPLLVYSSAISLSEKDPAGDVEAVFAENGWGGTWRSGIYSFRHYHSNAHEVLGVFSGKGTVEFGGAGGIEVELVPGDVVVLPAGTGHKKVESSSDFEVVGAYPDGSRVQWDMCYGNREELAQAIANIEKVPRPDGDPVFGSNGGLMDHWEV